MVTINLNQEVPVYKLNAFNRALSQIVSITPDRGPESICEKDLAGDCFHGLFIDNPKFLDSIPDERIINWRLMEYASKLPAWKELKQVTSNSILRSIIPAGLLWSMLTTDDAIKEASKVQEKIAQKKKQQKEAIDNNNPNIAANVQTDIDRLVVEGNKYFDENISNNQLVKAATISAINQAKKESDNISQIIAGWGIEAGQTHQISITDSLDIIQKSKCDKIKRIAEVAGRIHGICLQTIRSKVQYGVVPVDVIHTRDLSKMFVSERAYLSPSAPDCIRVQKIIKYCQTGLLGWELGSDAEKKGPFIAGIDISGSMRGEPEIMAKGISLGVARTAKTEGRKYTLFSFSTERDPIFEVKSTDNWQKHLEWGELSVGGGTSFDLALTRLMQLLNNQSNADALLISDGECKVSSGVKEKWIAFAKRTKCRLIYVPVAHGYQDIEKLADLVIPVDDITTQGDEIAKKTTSFINN